MIRGLVGIWLLLILWLSLILCLYSYRQKNWLRFLLSVLVAGISYYFLQLYSGEYADRPSDLSIMLICAVCSFLILLWIVQTYRWHQTYLSEMSVKYAVDALPTGICCYEEKGRILLKNKTMEVLHRKLTGKALLDGAVFEKLLFAPEKMQVNAAARFISTGEMIVVIFPDERVYEFQKEEMRPLVSDSRRNKEYVLTASEITEEYQKTQSLLKKQETVTELNERLRSYNQEILSAITAREILNAKIKIHDELGTSLLRIKKYLAQNPPEPKEAEADSHSFEQQDIISSLRRNVTFLQREMDPVEKDEYTLLLKTAKDLDVRVEIEGNLPEEKNFREIYVMAFHECLTNTLRHAKGNLLKVSFPEDANKVQGIFTNNGIAPCGEIVEKGGLKSLRNLVEQEDGNMEIRVKNGFWLSITFQKLIE